MDHHVSRIVDAADIARFAVMQLGELRVRNCNAPIVIALPVTNFLKISQQQYEQSNRWKLDHFSENFGLYSPTRRALNASLKRGRRLVFYECTKTSGETKNIFSVGKGVLRLRAPKHIALFWSKCSQVISASD